MSKGSSTSHDTTLPSTDDSIYSEKVPATDPARKIREDSPIDDITPTAISLSKRKEQYVTPQKKTDEKLSKEESVQHKPPNLIRFEDHLGCNSWLVIQ